LLRGEKRSGRDGSGRLLEAIPESPDRFDEAGFITRVAQLFPEGGDIDLQNVLPHRTSFSPKGIEEILLGDDLSLLQGQKVKDPELKTGEPDFPVPNRDFHPLGIKKKLPQGEHDRGETGFNQLLIRPNQHPDPGQKLAHPEWLLQKIVCAVLEGLDPDFDFPMARDGQDRGSLEILVGADKREDLGTRAHGKIEVHDGEKGPLSRQDPPEHPEGFLSVPGDRHGKPFLLEEMSQNPRNVRIVFDNDDDGICFNEGVRRMIHQFPGKDSMIPFPERKEMTKPSSDILNISLENDPSNSAADRPYPRRKPIQQLEAYRRHITHW